jgi:hypothetical protein
MDSAFTRKMAYNGLWPYAVGAFYRRIKLK